MLPGMPSRNSIPARRQRLASAATFFNFAPAPHLSLDPAASMPVKDARPSRTVNPRTPESSGRKFDPHPSTVTSSPLSRHATSNAERPASLLGSAKKSARPPAHKVVISASRQSGSTTVPSAAALSSTAFTSSDTGAATPVLMPLPPFLLVGRTSVRPRRCPPNRTLRKSAARPPRWTVPTSIVSSRRPWPRAWPGCRRARSTG